MVSSYCVCSAKQIPLNGGCDESRMRSYHLDYTVPRLPLVGRSADAAACLALGARHVCSGPPP